MSDAAITEPPPEIPLPPAELDQARRTSMAAEGVFTVGGIALACLTIVLVIAQS